MIAKLKTKIAIITAVLMTYIVMVPQHVYASSLIASLVERIEEFVRGILIGGIRMLFDLAFGGGTVARQIDAAQAMVTSDPLAPAFVFESVNAAGTSTTVTQQLEIAGTTLFNYIQNTLVPASVMPMAMAVLAFVIAYDLVQILISNNTSIDADILGITIKWMIKAWIAITLVTSWHLIIGGIFQIGQQVMGGIAVVGAGIPFPADITATIVNGLEATDASGNYLVSIGDLVIILIFAMVIVITFLALSVIINIIILARFFEIFISMSIAPIPMATLINPHWGQMGFNYLKTMLAYAFQGILMFLAILLYRIALNTWALNLGNAAAGTAVNFIVYMIFGAGLGVLLVMTLTKTGQLSKSLFNAS